MVGEHQDWHPEDRREDAEVGGGLAVVEESLDAERIGRHVQTASQHRSGLEVVEVPLRGQGEQREVASPVAECEP